MALEDILLVDGVDGLVGGDIFGISHIGAGPPGGSIGAGAPEFFIVAGDVTNGSGVIGAGTALSGFIGHEVGEGIAIRIDRFNSKSNVLHVWTPAEAPNITGDGGGFTGGVWVVVEVSVLIGLKSVVPGTIVTELINSDPLAIAPDTASFVGGPIRSVIGVHGDPVTIDGRIEIIHAEISIKKVDPVMPEAGTAVF